MTRALVQYAYDPPSAATIPIARMHVDRRGPMRVAARQRPASSIFAWLGAALAIACSDSATVIVGAGSSNIGTAAGASGVAAGSGSVGVGSTGGGQPGGGGATGAGRGGGEPTAAVTAGASGLLSGGAGGEPGSPGGTGDDPSAALYDPESFPRFDIELPAESIAALDQVGGAEDPLQATYVTATLRYGADSVTNIGLRFKGEASFQRLDQKPAFKLKFDELVPGQSFYGLRRMTLNNAFEDPSFLAERLAYDVFRAAGLPAPRCNNAAVYVNGVYYGVYVNVEAEDKTFLRRWFESDAGNLYEEGQTDFVPGAEATFNLETNEVLNDRTDLQGLIASIQAATNPATFLQDIDASMDTAQFLRFTAAEAAVNQWDMYAYTLFYVNNLRIYSDPTTQKFAFIPWGMDMSMKPFRDSGTPHIRLLAPSRQYDVADGPITAGLIFQRCLESPTCTSAYADAVRQIITVYEGLDMEARATRYYEQIRPMVLADTRRNVCCGGVPLTDAEFEAAVQSVFSTVRERVGALEADLAER